MALSTNTMEAVGEGVVSYHDPDAFTLLYELHAGRVYRHLYYLVGNPTEVEDLVSQTFLKAWVAIEDYEERGKLIVSWLLRIAHNVGLTYLRNRKEAQELPANLTANGRYDDPDEVLQRGLEADRVRCALLCLPPHQRCVLTLRFDEELSCREVATRMGRSVEAVRVLQHRALKALREELTRAVS
ncbi:hypothetical protein LCGC14_3034370 [marine sediment metagenome]|uniref:RNA polymerase sigma-70 region 2 domain-containing protein n=1 Tax=marine sediment metagenome TaxID=412755 RepID=A0A0F8XER7_9ZZZZ